MRTFWSLVVLMVTMISSLQAKDRTAFYIGTYTGGGSQGIYRSELNHQTGEMQPPVLVGEAQNPAFLAHHPRLPVLYSVSEVRAGNARQGAALVAWKIDQESGKLTEIGRASSGGDGPCHVSIAANGHWAGVANYGGGSVSLIRLDDAGIPNQVMTVQHEGGSGVVPSRQEGPHAHCVRFSPDDRHLLVTDLGLDRVFVYAIDGDALKPASHAFVKTAPGDGPRHMMFTPRGDNLLVINELACTVTSYRFDSKSGGLAMISTLSTLPENTLGPGITTAEVRVHPSGKFVYGSNRGHDSIAVMTLSEQGELSLVEIKPAGVKVPRNFNLLADGTWLIAAGQDSADLAAFRIDPTTGRLTDSGQRAQVTKPVCILPVGLQ